MCWAVVSPTANRTPLVNAWVKMGREARRDWYLLGSADVNALLEDVQRRGYTNQRNMIPEVHCAAVKRSGIWARNAARTRTRCEREDRSSSFSDFRGCAVRELLYGSTRVTWYSLPISQHVGDPQRVIPLPADIGAQQIRLWSRLQIAMYGRMQERAGPIRMRLMRDCAGHYRCGGGGAPQSG